MKLPGFGIVGLLLATFALPLAAQQVSLAEVAKQKPQRKAARVIENEDLVPGNGKPPAAPSEPKAPAVPDAAPAAAAQGHTATEPAESSGVSDARLRLESLRKEEAEMRRKYRHLEQRYQEETSEFRRQVMKEELANSTANLEFIRQKRLVAEEELERLRNTR